MALYDDKRFILSHIRHSFITCDDTGMCETVMLNEHSNRYPPESLYHHPFDYDSDEEYDPYHNYYTDYTSEEEEEEEEEGGEEEEDDEVKGQHHLNKELQSLKVKGELKNRITQSDLDFFKATEVEYKSELIEENAAQSFDIMSDSYDIMGIRRRSNTAQRLEKLRKERNFQSKTKVITWKSPTKIVEVMDDGTVNRVKRIVLYPGGLSKDELALLHYDEKDNVYYETDEYRKLLFPFIPDEPKSPVDELDGSEAQDQVGALSTASKPPKERRKSVLSMQIERSPNAPVNPFNEYTRFDGRVSEGNAHTKRIRIFFRLFEQDVEFQQADFAAKLASSGIACGPNWIEIVVLASGRVSDLIGLICWHYTHLQIGPPLKSDPCMYALKIAEENGDVDNDFPSLTQTDDIKRYGFPYLALVEIETHIVVTIFIESEEVFSQIIVNSLTTTLQDIVDQIKKKRAHLFRSIPLQGDPDPQVQLELRTKPGVALDLATRIGDYIEPSSQGGMGTSDRHSTHSHIGSVNFSLKLINHANRLSVMRNEGRVRKISAGFLDVTDATGAEEVHSSSIKGKLDTPSMLRANRHSSIALFNLEKEALVSNPSISPGTPGVTLTVPGTPGGQSSGGTLTRGGKLLRSREPKDWSQNMLDMMEAPLYQCFEVMAVNKLVNSPMEMGISGTKVEITPKTSNARSPNSHFTDRFFSKFNQMKAVNIDVEDVVDCCALPSVKVEILGRQLFKLVYYTGSDFKSLKFEGDGATVEDILFKLANVMKMRTSVRRNEYQAIKSRKKSISTKIYFKPRLMISSSSSDSEDEDGERVGGDGSETSTKEGPGGGGGGSVGAEGATGNINDTLDGSFYGQAAPGGSTVRSTKKDSKFRRFKSKQ